MSPTCDHLVLVGLMGVGKTTVGRHLSERLGWNLVDSDAQVEARTGRTVREIFEHDGEPAFRVLETEALRDALDAPGPTIVAAAGGVVLTEANRELLGRPNVTVVWLRAAPQILVARATTGDHRPLLEHDPAGVLAKMAVDRDPLYRGVADVVVDVDGLSPDEVTNRVLAAVGRVITVRVPLAHAPYDVLVGPGARHELAAVLPEGVRKVAVVTQADIGVDVDPGVEHKVFTIGVGEDAKSLATVERLCSQFTQWGLNRADCIAAVGGGLVTDVGGFAAAVYHRGLPVVHVATTLLGMVDAAIGGKTGVNLPEGKNLVGAYWQPAAVLCDTELLAGLPPREWRSGCGEMAKYHFLTGDDLMALPLDERIARCVEIKASVVVDDEREAEGRALLNYGHTLAHALETAGRYDLRHGEAVGIGLVYAAEVAHRLGRIDAGRVEEHRAVVASYDLPGSLPTGADPDELITLMGRDKKALGAVTFVLDGPRGLEIVRGVERGELAAALEAMR